MIELLEHNKPTYADLCEKMEKHNKVALVQATGTGKSYIIGKYLEEHKGKTLILVPAKAIGDQWEKLMAETDCDVTIDTYQGMAAHIEDESGYDIVIADEMHHLGSDVWGTAFINLFMQNTTQKVIGTTATEIRYLDNSRDMVEELFNGVATRGCDLRTAIENGILPSFTYVSVWYGNDNDYEEYAKKAEKIKDNDVRERTTGKLELCKQNQKSIEQAIEENLSDEPHKIVVFMNSIDSMDKVEKKIKKAFSANKTYKINSSMERVQIRRNIDGFRTSGNGNTVLFAIDMLNEGVHIDGVDTVAFFRTTESPAVYFQQLGRCLTTSEVSKRRTIFDFVCNSTNIRSIFEDDNKNICFVDRLNKKLPTKRKIIIRNYTKELNELFDEIERAITPKCFSDEEIRFIMNNSNMSASELAKTLSRPVTSIYKIARDHNIDLKTAKIPVHDPEIVKKIMEYADRPYKEISDITGVPIGTISGILIKNGIRKRDISRWSDDEKKIASDILLSNEEVAEKIGKSVNAVTLQRKKYIGMNESERVKNAVLSLFDSGYEISQIDEKLKIRHTRTRKILIENGKIEKTKRCGYCGKKKPIEQIKDGNIVKKYSSAREAAMINGYKSPGKINQAARKGTISYGYEWRYC